jgi:hypothetical protein
MVSIILASDRRDGSPASFVRHTRAAASATQALADALRAGADDCDISDENAARRLGGR